MNAHAIQILFLKDLFLSRRHLFAYFVGGMASAAMACAPNPTVAYMGFILIMTVAIAAGIHLIGQLLLAESKDQTGLFIMSLPVSLLDYSIGKMSVVLTAYLIPWGAMFAVCTICTFVLPWEKHGSVVVLPAIFLFLLCGFTLQLVTAVVTESVGCTICVLVGCNIALNLFLAKFFTIPAVESVRRSDAIEWPVVVLQVMTAECLLILVCLAVALVFQCRKRDLV